MYSLPCRRKRKNNKLYYYLVESARADGRARIVEQAYLGSATFAATTTCMSCYIWRCQKQPRNPKADVFSEVATADSPGARLRHLSGCGLDESQAPLCGNKMRNGRVTQNDTISQTIGLVTAMGVCINSEKIHNAPTAAERATRGLRAENTTHYSHIGGATIRSRPQE